MNPLEVVGLLTTAVTVAVVSRYARQRRRVRRTPEARRSDQIAASRHDRAQLVVEAAIRSRRLLPSQRRWGEEQAERDLEDFLWFLETAPEQEIRITALNADRRARWLH